MSSNSIGKNIVNAFNVVCNTYENVQKLMSYLKIQAEEKGEFICYSDKFLRWSSDKEIGGWAYRSFILIFQNAQDNELENTWRDGPLYAVEINFADYEEAMVNIARFDYADISNWSNVALSPSDHWRFYYPLYDDIIDYTEDDTNYDGMIRDALQADKRYWGIRRVVGFSVSLTSITVKNAYETIFGGFRLLKDK